MRHSAERLGYPRRSSIISTGGISGTDAFEHLCQEADIYAAVVMDGLINDLPVKERSAINHYHLGVIYKFDSLEKYFDSAIEILARKMPGKGLV